MKDFNLALELVLYIIPVSGATPPASVSAIDLKIKDELGNTLVNQNYTPSANLVYNYEWNGIDANNLETWAKVKRTIITTEAATDFNLPNENVHFVGNLKAKKLGTGGWLPTIWHFYDLQAKILFKGDGSFKNVNAVFDGSYWRIADSSGNEVYFFDNTGKIVHTKTGLTGAIKYTFSYDTQGRILTITEPFNRVTTFSRYASGVLKAIVAPSGAKASVTMNADGYMSKLVNPNDEIYLMTYYGTGGLLNTYMKPNGDITTLSYDGSGNFISSVHGNGRSVLLSNIVNGTKNTSAEGRETQTFFDGSTETTILPSGATSYFYHSESSDQSVSPTGTTNYYYYNDPRFPGQIKNLSGRYTTSFGQRYTTYNKTVSLLDSNDPFSINKLTETETIFNANNKMEYDGATRTKTYTTRLGRTNTIQLDEYERPIAETKGNLVTKDYTYTDHLLSKITQGTRKQVFSYYSNDLLKSIRNTLGETTVFTYDSARRLKTKTLPDARVITYSYDSNNNLTSITPPGKNPHNLNYGLNEELATYVAPALSSNISTTTTYTYNNDGQLVKITRPDGEEVNFNHDSASGLMTSITGSFGEITKTYNNGLLSTVKDQENNQIHLTYQGDTVNQAIFYANGGTISSYQRTPFANAGGKTGTETVRGYGTGSVAQSISYNYDHDEYVTQIGDLNLAYNTPNGQLTGTILGTLKDFYYYNAFGELRKYIVKHHSTIIYEYELERDGIGRIIKKTETLNNVTSIFDYLYDSAGRLIQVSTNGVISSTYTYDSNSNRNGGTIRGETINATYDEQDRLTNYNGIAMTYNPNGELLSKGSDSLVYDILGNLKEYVKNGTTTIGYDIDPLQRRVGRKVNGVLKARYIYNPEGKVVGQLDSDNKLIKTFVYGAKTHVPDYYIDQNGNKFKIVTDHLGSLRLVVSKSGRILQMMEHDEFGRVMQDTRPEFMPFGFAGGLYENRSGLVRFGARDYDPQTGRWTMKDPIRFEGGDTNLYGYVLQDPVNFIDPTGLAIPGQDQACDIYTKACPGRRLQCKNGQSVGDFLDTVGDCGCDAIFGGCDKDPKESPPPPPPVEENLCPKQ